MSKTTTICEYFAIREKFGLLTKTKVKFFGKVMKRQLKLILI